MEWNGRFLWGVVGDHDYDDETETLIYFLDIDDTYKYLILMMYIPVFHFLLKQL